MPAADVAAAQARVRASSARISVTQLLIHPRHRDTQPADECRERGNDFVVELEGVDRARQAQTVSDVTLVVLDAADPLDEDDRSIIAETRDSRRLVVANKSDLGHAWSEPEAVRVSARTRAGLDVLRRRLIEALEIEPIGDSPAITNVRHIGLVRRAQDGLVRARTAARAALSEEFVLADLQEARIALEEITGQRTPDDVLTHIFSKFCIGK